MSLTMYQASIPVFIHTLQALSKILDKAAASAEARKIDPSVLINARLAPDMLPLSKQIQIATDGTKGCAARLAGVDVPSFPDTETTFPELQARLARTVDFLKTIKPEQIDASETRKVTLKIGGKDMVFEGQPYLLSFVLPNMYFHAAITHAILRHNGVDIGKRDFLGGM
jgi:hypothetical protein